MKNTKNKILCKLGIVFTVLTLTLFFQSCLTTDASGSTGNPTITIVNETGYTVWYLRISTSSDDMWGPDRLASDQVLHNGQSFTMVLPHRLSVTNKYDIQLEDSDGDTYSKYNVTVSDNDRIIFRFNDIDDD